VSARIGARFWIIQADASGEPRAEPILCYDVDQDLPAGASAAAAVHQRIFRTQPEAAAIVHAHAPFGIAVSFGGRDFQPVDYEGQRSFGSVPVVRIDPEDPEEAAAAGVAEALGGFPSCLVAGRGSYAWGVDLEQALGRIQLLELSARIYILARQAAAL
ncbi:MAG: class II aldolase/adducin family protein, partial [Thiohalocapsa sp.]